MQHSGSITHLPRLLLTSFILLLCAPLSAEQTQLNLLSLPALDHWEENSFVGHTRYEIVQLDGATALMASSHKSASGLVRKQTIDLNKTPYLHWSWRVENELQNVDERTKAGDDYPARIYVVISGGLFFWRTRALNYVWSSNQPVGSVWPNAFTSNATLVALRNSDTPLHTWVKEKRNLRDDIKRYLNIDADHIDAVAIMTDTDNSGQAATAYYGNIFFTEH